MIRHSGLRQVIPRRTGDTGASALSFTQGLTQSGSTVTNDLITGKAGGQTVVGGTGVSENLVLQSTTNASRGLVVSNDQFNVATLGTLGAPAIVIGVPGNAVGLYATATTLNVGVAGVGVATLGGGTTNYANANFPIPGSATLPSISFGPPANKTGIYGDNAGFLGLLVGGTTIVSFASNATNTNFPIHTAFDGTAGNVSWGETTTGFYFSDSGTTLNTSVFGVNALTIHGSQLGVGNFPASTEGVGFDYTGRSRTWATGPLGLQREHVFRAPTYNFAGASTITTAATLTIVGAPIAGANATITSSLSLWVQAGIAQFDGGVFTPTITGGTTLAQNLTLQSTSNASRGSIVCNDSLGVGRAAGVLGTAPQFAVAGSVQITAQALGAFDFVQFSPSTTVVGVTPITNALGFNAIAIDAPAITANVPIGAGGTTPAAATLVISGVPAIVAGTGSFAGTFGPVGLWVQTAIGQTSAVFDGNLIIGAAAGSTAGLQLQGTNGIILTQASSIISATSTATQTIVKSGGTADLIINNASGGGALILQGGNVEAFRILSTATAGRIQFASSAMAANGAVATAMSALGPAGSHTTIQEWLTFFNASGVQRWVPCF